MFNTLALISVFVVILSLKALVSVFPSAVASVIRCKENMNMESSVKLSRDRDICSAAMVLPFCLCTFRFRLYDPSFISSMPDGGRIWAIIGIFIFYVATRDLARRLSRPHRMQQKICEAANKSANTFFIILTLALLAFGSIASFAGMSNEAIRQALIWLSSLIYGLYLIRKLQIFTSSSSIFAGFLYLCALEILPTGILVVSDVIF